MDDCILCGRSAGEAPARGVVQTGWLAGSTVVDVARGATPNQRVITSRLTYLDVRAHPVAFCPACWRRNAQLLSGLKGMGVLSLAGAAAMVVMLILQGNHISGWAFLGGVPAVLLLVLFLPVAQAISPAHRALEKVRALRHEQEPGSAHDWVPFKAHWPEKPFQVMWSQRSQRNDTWSASG